MDEPEIHVALQPHHGGRPRAAFALPPPTQCRSRASLCRANQESVHVVSREFLVTGHQIREQTGISSSHMKPRVFRARHSLDSPPIGMKHLSPNFH
jgi:hypothetical protein